MKDNNAKVENEAKDKDAKSQPAPEAARQGGEEKTQDDRAELKERLLRLAAEFDNYKKRTMKDIGEAKELGKAELLRSMLGIVDEFDLMLVSAMRSDDKALAKGVELLYSNFMDALKKSGLKEVDTTDKFDPYKHEIMMVREEDGKEDGHILEVIKKGYAFNGKMLRAAAVIVAKPKIAEADSEKDGQKNNE